MVGPCGLEPQTSSVSRMRSNQLSYGPLAYGAKFLLQASRLQNSTCLQGQSATVSRKRSNQLSYGPIALTCRSLCIAIGSPSFVPGGRLGTDCREKSSSSRSTAAILVAIQRVRIANSHRNF